MRTTITAAIALTVALMGAPCLALGEEVNLDVEAVTAEEAVVDVPQGDEDPADTDSSEPFDDAATVGAVAEDEGGSTEEDEAVLEEGSTLTTEEPDGSDEVVSDDEAIEEAEQAPEVEVAVPEEVPSEEALPEEAQVSLEAASVGVSKTTPKTTAAPRTITRKGWNQAADGTWYWSKDGKNAAHGWQSIGGVWYYFDTKTGAMKCDEAFSADGKTYVANKTGACPANRWVKAAGKWYLTDSSCACRSGWAKAGSTWYYLDAKTKAMKTDEAFTAGKKTYVANASGACPAGSWVKAAGEWYLTDASCACRSGWTKSGGAWYYLNAKTKAMVHRRTFSASGKTYVAEASGVCPANAWAEVKGKWYLTDRTCACRSGWVVFDGTTYYFDPKTKVMKQDESFTVNGKAYLASESGAIAGGSWNETARGWYYTTGAGVLATGWTKVNGVWYYFDKTGLMKQGEVFTDEGKRYIARRDGSCPVNAWVENGGSWYRTDGSCAVRTGWWSTGVTLYYFNNKGVSLTGEQTISGKRYFFYAPMGGLARSEYVTLKDGSRAYVNGDGIISASGPTYGGSAKAGWSKYSGDWYYIDAETGKPTTGWITYKNKRYWLDPEGVMVTGSRLIDGKAYWFSTDGDLLKELDGTVEDLVKVAEADLGYDVNEDKATGSVYGRWYQEMCNPWKGSIDYGADDVAWCVMAVSYWCYNAGVGAPGIPHAGCETIAEYARREGLVVAPEDVERGQLILYDWDEDGEPDHIGIVEKRVSDRKVKSVEGNTSDKVASRTRDIDSIYCGVKAYLV